MLIVLLNRYGLNESKKRGVKTALFKFCLSVLGLHSYHIVQLLLIYLSFLKIVHHCSSQIGSNSKGTQKMTSFKS